MHRIWPCAYAMPRPTPRPTAASVRLPRDRVARVQLHLRGAGRSSAGRRRTRGHAGEVARCVLAGLAGSIPKGK
jgi:hypothetical protein